MPLLRRQPFIKEPIPEDLKPDEELFHCKLTNEVFRDYDAFFERVILCNSLVWTCELTGRPGLTYLEAVNVEERARVTLAELPLALKRAMMCLATYSRHTRLCDLCDDVFGYMKDRFFVGEQVETVVKGERKSCLVVKVLPPHSNNSSSKSSMVNGNSHVSDDSENEVDPSTYRYQVRDLATCKGPTHVVTFADVMRKRRTFTREKNKLFLKQACEVCNGVWLAKVKFVKKYGLDEMKFRDLFCGTKPIFDTKKRSSPSAAATKEKLKAHQLDEKFKERVRKDSSEKSDNKSLKKRRKRTHPDGDSNKQNGKLPKLEHDEPAKERELTKEERLKAKEEQKQKLEEERRKRKEEKDKEREKQKEERRIFAECLREWQKPRDDLECDDLMDLPTPVPVGTAIPNELFGDVLLILEFVHDVSDFLCVKDYFPSGLTIEVLEKALLSSDVRGPLNDLLQMLVVATFRVQDDDENGGSESAASSFSSEAVRDDPQHRAALLAANWPNQTLGISLKKLDLDAFTLSEILRLHLSSSGVSLRNKNHVNRDDPGFHFRLTEENLLATMASVNVFDLKLGDKIKIINTLIGQLLSSEVVKEDVEDNIERLRLARYDYRLFQWAEQRREREEAALRNKKKLEEQQRLAAQEDDDGAKSKEGDKEESKDKETTTTTTNSAATTPASADDDQETKPRKAGARRERELADVVNRLQGRAIVQPLGRDRAFRRFWMFNSLPGLFVEDDDDTVGPCLPLATPYNPNSNPCTSFNLSVSEARKHRANQEATSGDKENAAVVNGAVGHNRGHHKLLGDSKSTTPNGLVVMADAKSATGQRRKSSTSSSSGSSQQQQQENVKFGMCNALNDKCPVHGSASAAVKWAFFPTAAHVESLIAALNPRGFREGSLKEVLVAEKKRVLQSVSRCPVVQLSSVLAAAAARGGDKEATSSPSPSERKTRDVGEEDATTTCEHVLYLTLRDTLLELEEKIYAGGLGSLKMEDREAWRGKLLGEIVELDQTTTTEAKQSEDGRSEEKQQQQCHNSADSRRATVSGLSAALLQIFRGIEPKYLTPPLASPWSENGFPESDGVGKAAAAKSLSSRWQEALMSCTSLSQVFLHLSSLERSVAWSRSVLNARCRACRRKGDAEHMLLCDGCDRGHHIYCLKPPLTEIPEGDWMCEECCPRQKPLTTKRRRVVRFEEEEEDDSDDDDEDEEEEDFTAAPEQKLPSLCSASAIKSEVSAVGEVDEPSKDRRSNAKKSSDDVPCCCKCRRRNGEDELIACAGDCHSSYHLTCVNPVLRRIPRGRWICPNCCWASTTTKGSGGTYSSSREASPVPHGASTAAAGLRRSERNVKRVHDYSRHSRGDYSEESDDDDDDDEETAVAKRPRTRRRVAEIPDEEWYGLVRRQTPPSRRGASNDVPLDFKTCDQLLTDLVRHEDGWPFLKPVTRKEVADYYDIIKRPVDFGTIRSRLNRMSYPNNAAFVADILLVFQNCCLFNPYASLEYRAAERLGLYFVRRIRGCSWNNLELRHGTREEVEEEDYDLRGRRATAAGVSDDDHQDFATVNGGYIKEEESSPPLQGEVASTDEDDEEQDQEDRRECGGPKVCMTNVVDFEVSDVDDDEDRLVVDV